MTTKFLTRKFASFPHFIVIKFTEKKKRFWTTFPQISPSLSFSDMGYRTNIASYVAKWVIAPFWGSANLRDMGYRSDSIATSLDMGPFPCPSSPWCFCFLGVFLAGDFLGLLGCFLLIFQGF